jgi:preprotein translocase subunit SecG
MLYYFVATVYVLVCFLLLIVVLLQQGKGGDMASAFGGGGSQTAFGARQGATVLSKATAILGGLFMIGALGLAYLGNTGSSGRGCGEAGSGPGRSRRPADGAARRCHHDVALDTGSGLGSGRSAETEALIVRPGRSGGSFGLVAPPGSSRRGGRRDAVIPRRATSAAWRRCRIRTTVRPGPSPPPSAVSRRL